MIVKEEGEGCCATRHSESCPASAAHTGRLHNPKTPNDACNFKFEDASTRWKSKVSRARCHKNRIRTRIITNDHVSSDLYPSTTRPDVDRGTGETRTVHHIDPTRSVAPRPTSLPELVQSAPSLTPSVPQKSTTISVAHTGL